MLALLLPGAAPTASLLRTFPAGLSTHGDVDGDVGARGDTAAFEGDCCDTGTGVTAAPDDDGVDVTAPPDDGGVGATAAPDDGGVGVTAPPDDGTAVTTLVSTAFTAP